MFGQNVLRYGTIGTVAGHDVCVQISSFFFVMDFAMPHKVKYRKSAYQSLFRIGTQLLLYVVSFQFKCGQSFMECWSTNPPFEI